MTRAVTFRAGLLGARPRQVRLPQRHGRRRRIDRCPRSVAKYWQGGAHYTHLAPSDRAGARRNHSGKNPLRLCRGRPLIAIGGRTAAGFSIGTLSLHVAQYAPCERVSRRQRTPRRNVITVSAIVGPPHRLHSIAMPRLRLSFSMADIKRKIERIKNNNDPVRPRRHASPSRRLDGQLNNLRPRRADWRSGDWDELAAIAHKLANASPARCGSAGLAATWCVSAWKMSRSIVGGALVRNLAKIGVEGSNPSARSSSVLHKLSPPKFALAKRPGSRRFCALGLGFVYRNDSENLSLNGRLSPKLGG
jgi:hypothetical protein